MSLLVGYSPWAVRVEVVVGSLEGCFRLSKTVAETLELGTSWVISGC